MPDLRSKQAEDEYRARLRMERIFPSGIQATGIRPDPTRQPMADFREKYPVLSQIGDFLTGGATDPNSQIGVADLLTAALPMAIPRSLHKSLIKGIGGEYGYSEKFSPEFTRAISEWTGGRAMFNRYKNLEFAKRLRQYEDKKIIQNYLREALGTDTIPLFRGVRENEIDELIQYYHAGNDPGIRSFSMEPKVTHAFAGVAPWYNDKLSKSEINRLRAERGQIYRIDAPIENIVGYGQIPYQSELIIDLKGLNPTEKMKSLRKKPGF